VKHWFWSRLVPSLASLKVVVGLAAFFLTYSQAAGRDPIYPYTFFFLFSVAFGATAALLLLGGRNDARAFSLGGFFLVGATAWANTPLGKLTHLQDGPESLFFAALNALELDAFMAFYLWIFIREFPHPPGSVVVSRRMTLAARIAAAAGILFFSLNVLRFLVQQTPALEEALGRFAPQRGTGLYYGVAMPLLAAAFPVLIWKAWSLKGDDQRRLRMFLQVLAITFGPMLIEILLELFAPGYLEYTRSRPSLRLGISVAVCSIGLTLPVTVPYAVLVYRVLDVKLIARRALQYALARSSVLVLIAAPLLALAWYFYANRSLSLNEIFTGRRVALLLSASVLGAAALYYRKALLDLIDRRFFREQYDARQILTLLVERIRGIHEAESLASLVSREIDLALHLEGIAMMVLDPKSGMLVDPRSRARRLDASSELALAISNASDPLEVDLENAHSRLKKLPERERHWLVDSGFRLIVPILARDGSLLGLVGLGEKKSGLPFLKEDRQLLHAIASSAAWVLELDQGTPLVPRRRLQDALAPDDATPPGVPVPSVEHAKECANCGVVYQSYTVFCSNCSRRLEVSRVPFVLPGKFRFEKRIGAGGMGVVYRGADLALGRHVAIKTLRRVSPEDAMRLRREARTAAAVSHPHLAAVYGMETWHGTPLLVMELLEGGTLAQKMANGCRMAPARMVELGIAMTEALAHLHSADILHRDIKPSNIGYTRDGAPKLMDFGIAGLVLDLRREEDLTLLSSTEDDSVLMPPASVWGKDGSSPTASRRQLAGTLSYLSPEALNREPPDASFDLWSLGIVLYECLLGRKIFTGGDSQQLMARIRHGRVPEFSQVLPEYDEVLGDLFRRTLHRTRSRRPATAQDLRLWLLELRPYVAHLDEAGPAA
jgi:eukaryotic-like serine/threonine-protein kinase